MHTKCGQSVIIPARISSMIGPEFPPSPKEGSWLAVCVGVLGSNKRPFDGRAIGATPRQYAWLKPGGSEIRVVLNWLQELTERVPVP